jgi:DNA-binding MarR family transcriptional regulator
MEATTLGQSREPQWLDEREARAWRSFIYMQANVRRVVGKELQQETGLSDADYAVLVHLSEAPDGRLRPFQLGVAADWEKSRLSHHLTRMERRGLVERQSCPSDNRGAFVALTPTGRTAIEKAAPIHVEQVRHWFISALSPEQLEALTEISETLLDRLDVVSDGTESCQAREDGGWVDEGL